MALLEEDVLDEALEDLVGGVEVYADDQTGDQDDDGSLDHVRLARPLDLLQLGPALGDEPLRPASGHRAPTALALARGGRGANGRLARASALRCRRGLGLCLAAGAALGSGLLCHATRPGIGGWYGTGP